MSTGTQTSFEPGIVEQQFESSTTMSNVYRKTKDSFLSYKDSVDLDESILSVHDPDMNYSPISDEDEESDSYSGESEKGRKNQIT